MKKEGEQAFRESYERLNAGQKRAVDTIEGPVVVMAGPGTGKTQVLTLRIANILRTTDIPPDAILALTYTNSGVAAMRERLRLFIGNDAYRVNIHTFHGYASSVIDSHPDAFPRIIGATSADDVDRHDIVRTAIAKVGAESLRPPGNPEYYIQPILKLIGTLKNDRVGVEEYSEYMTTLKDEGVHDSEDEVSTKTLRSGAFLDVFRMYESLMRERSLYDFSDMLVELTHALETNQDLKLELSESAQYILADEHQDANRSQNKILELLSDFHDNPNLFIVGDDKQAIYRFQGASLENFLYFKNKYQKGVVIALTENYRSTEEILRSAHSLMRGRSAGDVELIAKNGKGKAVEVLVAGDEDEEIAVVTERIEALISSGVRPSDIAILLRKNKDIDSFLRSLRSKGVLCVSFRDSDALASSEVMLLISLVRASVNPHDDVALSRALFLPSFALSTEALSTLFHTHARSKSSLYELLGEHEGTRKARVFFDNIMKYARTKNAIEALDILVAESGFLPELVTADDLVHALEAYRSVRTLIESRSERERQFALTDALHVLDDLTRGVASLPIKRDKGGVGVKLMSLHKSKGLEFDHVFLPHALESRFKPRADRSLFVIPPYVNQPETSIDDERRLFYVGITRARHHVYISRHEKRSDEKEEVPLSFISDLEGSTEIQVSALNVTVVPTRSTHTKYRKEYDAIIAEFLSHGISATALNVYLRDPWECFFSSILKLPRTKDAHQLYGSAMHTALERFFTHLKEGGVKDKDVLIQAFKSALGRTPLVPKDHAVYQKKGVASLESYFNAHIDDLYAHVATEVSVTADLPLIQGSRRESVPLHGFLDKVEYTEGDTVRVVDYKTGSPKSRNTIEGKTKDSNGDYKRQLVFYKILLAREGKHTMNEGIIDFVEPNSSGKHKREAFVITDGEVLELTHDIARMVDDLVDGTFLTKTSVSEDTEVRALAHMLAKRFVTE